MSTLQSFSLPRTSLAAVLVLPLFAACGGSSSGYTKNEARDLGGVTPDGQDICALEGWYNDAECDDFCPEPDPDCVTTECPDPNDPNVSYYGEPGSNECAQDIDFCGPDKVTFNNECGCGCITPEPPAYCGGAPGTECEEGQFCNYTREAVCGAADALGTCEPIPDACADIYAPVCGCDGVTYSNECTANGNGVAVQYEGECEVTITCGGITGESCGEGEFCNYTLDAMCGFADATGTCEPLPEGCPAVYDPVCGCDGVTYSNACVANTSGVAVQYEGECGASGNECGGFLGLVCGADEFCDYTPEAMCGYADALGTCEPVPTACPDIFAPVCGCDGMTYSNDCDANAAGFGVFHDGPCEEG
jgi:hypothetical protein